MYNKVQCKDFQVNSQPKHAYHVPGVKISFYNLLLPILVSKLTRDKC